MFTARQIGILNSLVTFAAENVPGGLSKDEQTVARTVGRMALARGAHKETLRAAAKVEKAATSQK